MRWLVTAACAAACAAALASCSINRRSGQFECDTTSDCDAGRTCVDGLCVGASSDAGPPRDAGKRDAGVDAATCPAPCTSCGPGRTCTIDCSAGANCAVPVVCPPGWSCAVRCNTQGACRSGVDCSDGEDCDIQCTGAGSCRNVDCGAGRCSVSCFGQSSCRDVACGEACACDVRCSFGAACEQVACTAQACSLGGGCASALPGCNTCQ